VGNWAVLGEKVVFPCNGFAGAEIFWADVLFPAAVFPWDELGHAEFSGQGEINGKSKLLDTNPLVSIQGGTRGRAEQQAGARLWCNRFVLVPSLPWVSTGGCGGPSLHPQGSAP